MTSNKGKAFRAALATATMLAGGAMLLPAAASAQVTTSQLRGQVTAVDGTAAAGATVTARDTGTNQTRTTTTDPNGQYSLNGLRPGTYEVIVTQGATPPRR